MRAEKKLKDIRRQKLQVNRTKWQRHETTKLKSVEEEERVNRKEKTVTKKCNVRER